MASLIILTFWPSLSKQIIYPEASCRNATEWPCATLVHWTSLTWSVTLVMPIRGMSPCMRLLKSITVCFLKASIMTAVVLRPEKLTTETKLIGHVSTLAWSRSAYYLSYSQSSFELSYSLKLAVSSATRNGESWPIWFGLSNLNAKARYCKITRRLFC